MADWVSVFANGPVPVKVWAGGQDAIWDWEGSLGFGDTTSFSPNVPDEPGITVTVAVDSSGRVSLAIDGNPNGGHGFFVYVEKPVAANARQVSDVTAIYWGNGWYRIGCSTSSTDGKDGNSYELTPPDSGMIWTPNPQVIPDEFPLFGAYGHTWGPV